MGTEQISTDKVGLQEVISALGIDSGRITSYSETILSPSVLLSQTNPRTY